MLLLAADGLAADPRLKAPVTIGERYLPLPELARRLAAATRQTVRVDGDMAARKVVLFVDGRPAAEAMRMAASALGGRWARVGGEWHLRPDSAVARDEAASADAEARARRAAVVGWAEGFVRDPPLAQEIPAIAKASTLVAKLGPDEAADALLAGRTLVATRSGRNGTVSLPLADALDVAAPDLVLSLWLEDDARRVTIRLAPLGGEGHGLVTGTPVPPPKVPPAKVDPWTVDLDPAASGRTLAALPLGAEPSPTGLESLADALERLHARSGLPVAAESFREPLRAFAEIPGATARDALRALALETRWTGAPFRWRAEGGWILVRPARPWAERPGEIPESALRPLEGRDPSLDEYADLAAGLTEPQVAATARFRPLGRFSLAPLIRRDRVRALALFGSLSPSERGVARSQGLLWTQMSPDARARWDRAYGDLVLEFPSAGGTYLDLLGGRRPEDAGLQIRASFTESRGVPGREPDWSARASRYASDDFVFRLDPSGPFSLVVPVPVVPLSAMPNASSAAPP